MGAYGAAPRAALRGVGRRRPAPLKLLSLEAFRAATAWRLVLLPLLFAIAWQSIVVETHRHLDPAIGWQAAAKAAAAESTTPDPTAPVDLPSACPVCRAVAHAGQAILPVALVLALPTQSVFRVALAILASFPVGQRFHGWRSRAPPADLSTQR